MTTNSHSRTRELPPVVGSVTVSWDDCNFGKKPPSRLQVRRGIPPSVALFTDDEMYISPDAPVKAAQNPLHTYFFSARKSSARRSCQPRTVEGPIAGVDYFGVVYIDNRRVSITADTRLLTPEVDGVPRLPKGTWVKVDALKCPKRVALIARSISD